MKGVPGAESARLKVGGVIMNEQRGSPLEVGSYCAVFELHFTLAHDGSEQREH